MISNNPILEVEPSPNSKQDSSRWFNSDLCGLGRLLSQITFPCLALRKNESVPPPQVIVEEIPEVNNGETDAEDVNAVIPQEKAMNWFRFFCCAKRQNEDNDILPVSEVIAIDENTRVTNIRTIRANMEQYNITPQVAQVHNGQAVRAAIAQDNINHGPCIPGSSNQNDDASVPPPFRPIVVIVDEIAPTLVNNGQNVYAAIEQENNNKEEHHSIPTAAIQPIDNASPPRVRKIIESYVHGGILRFPVVDSDYESSGSDT